MSRDVSNRVIPSTTYPRSQPSIASPQTAEPRQPQGVPSQHVDTLIDEVFAEVEHILETGAAPLPDPEPGDADIVVLKPLPLPDVDILPDLENGPSAAPANPKVTPLRRKPTPWPTRSEKFLLGLVIVSFSTAASLFLFARDRYEPVLAWLTGNAEQATAVDPSSTSSSNVAQKAQTAEPEFVDYLQKSLTVLETEGQTLAALQAGQARTGQPVSTVNGAIAPFPLSPGSNYPIALGQNAPTVLERVYIPIYQNSPTTAGLGNLPVLNDPTLATLPPIPVPADPSGSSIPPLNASPSPTGITPTAPAITAAASSNTTGALAAIHTLVGILELGDRSAALFEMNGVTRRIHLGETIGNSGWALVEVANQEALVRRNGEVRTIYIGQSF